MNIERLNHLITVLENVPPDHFDLDTWRYGWLNGKPDVGYYCGYTACAIGWACADPKFQAEGLSYSDGAPKFGGHTGWAAVQTLLGLTYSQVLHLFSLEAYDEEATPAAVIASIRKVIEEGV